MKTIINDKQVELATLNGEQYWMEVGTTNIIGKISEVPTKEISFDATEEQKIIGSRIRAARESKGINTVQMAHLTAIGRNNIKLIEEGGTSAGVQVLIRICRALDITLDQLVAGI